MNTVKGIAPLGNRDSAIKGEPPRVSIREPDFLEVLDGQVAIIDGAGKILHVNSSWQEFALANGFRSQHGYNPYALGMNYLEVCESTTGPEAAGALEVARGIRAVIAGTQREFSQEYPCHSKHKNRWIKVLVRPLREADKTPDRFVVQHLNITKQVLRRMGSERTAQTYEENLADFVEALPVQVASIGDDLTYRFANSRFAQRVGKEKDDIPGRKPVEVIGKKAWDVLRPYVSRALNGERVTFEADLSLLNGTRIQAIVTYLPDRLPSGDVIGFMAFIQDVTELKRRQQHLYLAMQAAEQANRAKSQFLASMSHELRTPLNAIIGFAEMIALGIAGPAEVGKNTEYAKDILDSARHLLSMVEDILDLSAIEGGKVTIVKKPVDLLAILAECERAISQQVESKHQILLVEKPASEIRLIADERAVRQVLLNILSNAVKYTPDYGGVVVDIENIGDAVRIQVIDTGVGIAPEKLGDVTDAFTRAGQDEPYVAEKGWGLGLSISKSLIDLHGGKLEIDSDVDQGTTVTITLPSGVEHPASS